MCNGLNVKLDSETENVAIVMQNSNIVLLKTIEALQVLLVQYILTFVLKAYNSCALISLIDMLCIGKRGLSDTLHTTSYYCIRIQKRRLSRSAFLPQSSISVINLHI